MTEVAKDALRLRLVLGKYQVRKIDKGLTGLVMTISLPSGVFMKCDLPFQADVRVGDILTFYTEVLADMSKLPPPQPN